jgi:hypothetical protein
VDPDPESDTGAPAAVDWDHVDWFDAERQAFSRYDGSWELGSGFWPVDTGLDGDPRHFAVRWVGWLRVRSGGGVSWLAGGADDLLVRVDDTDVVALTDATELDVATYDAPLSPGVYPIDLRYAHRRADVSALRLRLLDNDAALCPPAYR